MSEEQYPLKEVTEKIIGAAFQVHNRLGGGFQEKVYENALMKELGDRGLSAEQQKSLKIIYGGIPVGDFIADILVNGSVIVELKAQRSIEKQNEVQLQNYLKASGIEVGLLINFGQSVQVKRKIFSLAK